MKKLLFILFFIPSLAFAQFNPDDYFTHTEFYTPTHSIVNFLNEFKAKYGGEFHVDQNGNFIYINPKDRLEFEFLKVGLYKVTVYYKEVYIGSGNVVLAHGAIILALNRPLIEKLKNQ